MSSSRRRKILAIAAGVLLLAVLAVGAYFGSKEWDQYRRYQELQELGIHIGTEIGHMGEVRGTATGGGQYEARLPYLRDRDQFVGLLLAKPPDGPVAPRGLLLIKLVRGATSDYSAAGGVGGDGSTLHLSVLRKDRDGKGFEVKYEMTFAPPAEEWSLGGQPVAPGAGRVFLIDLNEQPPNVERFEAGLGELFPNPERNPGWEEFSAAVESLRERNERVSESFRSIGPR